MAGLNGGHDVIDAELKLGDLEVASLEEIWAHGSHDARQLHSRIGERRGISLQTVQSTLERLYKKRVLQREKVSHAYIYSPRLSREEVMAKLVSDTLSRFGSASHAALASSNVALAGGLAS